MLQVLLRAGARRSPYVKRIAMPRSYLKRKVAHHVDLVGPIPPPSSGTNPGASPKWGFLAFKKKEETGKPY